MEYQHYEGMGVPITWEILERSRKPSNVGEFPCLYEETTEEDYRVAISIQERKCCVTFSEISNTKENKKDDTSKDIITSEFKADPNSHEGVRAYP